MARYCGFILFPLPGRADHSRKSGQCGTGAAAVTSLKNSGRSPEIGIAEVHQALAVNGLRNKVILRGSGAYRLTGKNSF